MSNLLAELGITVEERPNDRVQVTMTEPGMVAVMNVDLGDPEVPAFVRREIRDRHQHEDALEGRR